MNTFLFLNNQNNLSYSFSDQDIAAKQAITIDGTNYIVSGCRGIIASGSEDTSAPTCKLKATSSGVIFEAKSDDEGVTSFGSEAFCGCTNLESISIPYSVQELGSSEIHDNSFFEKKEYHHYSQDSSHD
mgnify:CR=1 FL=1